MINLLYGLFIMRSHLCKYTNYSFFFLLALIHEFYRNLVLYLGTAEGSISEGTYCNQIISPLMRTLLSDLKNFKFSWYVSHIMYHDNIHYDLTILFLGESQALKHLQFVAMLSEGLKNTFKVV